MTSTPELKKLLEDVLEKIEIVTWDGSGIGPRYVEGIRDALRSALLSFLREAGKMLFVFDEVHSNASIRGDDFVAGCDYGFNDYRSAVLANLEAVKNV